MPSTSLSFSSVIRGHHVYRTIWTAYPGEKLVLAAEKEDIVNLSKIINLPKIVNLSKALGGIIETQFV